jgi:Phosphotransferase enzyme family
VTLGSALPGSVSAVTPAWLTEVLHTSGALQSGRVTSVDLAPLSGGIALMSHMTRLLLVYDVDDPGAPESLIAKFPPADPESRAVGLEMGFFEGESGFYGQLAERTGIRAPRCYFSHFEPGSGRFVTLLEDLSAARLGDVDTGCTHAEAAVGVETLARLHVSWWNDAAVNSYPWLHKFEDRLNSGLGFLPEAWPTFVSRFRDRLEPAQFELLLELREKLGNAKKMRSPAVRTLLHGDFKLDNLFFLPSGEMVICDWGLVMTGHPMFDVASFLSINIPVEQRRQLDVDLVRKYTAALEAAGVQAYDFDAAMADYKPQLVALLPRMIGAGGLAQFTGDEAMESYALGLRRVICAIADHGGLGSRLWE